jgi:hypothetical protein
VCRAFPDVPRSRQPFLRRARSWWSSERGWGREGGANGSGGFRDAFCAHLGGAPYSPLSTQLQLHSTVYLYPASDGSRVSGPSLVGTGVGPLFTSPTHPPEPRALRHTMLRQPCWVGPATAPPQGDHGAIPLPWCRLQTHRFRPLALIFGPLALASIVPGILLEGPRE